MKGTMDTKYSMVLQRHSVESKVMKIEQNLEEFRNRFWQIDDFLRLRNLLKTGAIFLNSIMIPGNE